MIIGYIAGAACKAIEKRYEITAASTLSRRKLHYAWHDSALDLANLLRFHFYTYAIRRQMAAFCLLLQVHLYHYYGRRHFSFPEDTITPAIILFGWLGIDDDR